MVVRKAGKIRFLIACTLGIVLVCAPGVATPAFDGRAGGHPTVGHPHDSAQPAVSQPAGAPAVGNPASDTTRNGAALGTTPAPPPQELDPSLYTSLKYRYIGPVGNRVSSVTGVPGNPRVYYVGAASGGIWKTSDGGATWAPIFDEMPAQSIGSLAVAPSDHNIIWAGTGETFIRSNVSLGNGIYKSTDGGHSWRKMGLELTGRIGRIVVHPTNPDIVFAAAMGHSYGPQEERGVFRTKDGGETWERVLFVDENTGASDIAMDPNNPRNLFAGMWQLIIRTYGRESGGPGSGVFVSRDGGDTWERLGTDDGLPPSPLGKIALAVAPSNSSRVFALIETGNGGLWRSDDGGHTWQETNRDHILAQRSHYYSRMAVAPDDHNEVYFQAVRLTVSRDGGRTVDQVPGRHGDNHDMWIDPMDGDRMIVGNDGGAMISVTRGETWLYPRLPIAQMYHVAVDDQIPYNVYGNRQDGPSTRGPSNSRLGGFGGGSIPIGMWHSVGGCESGFAVPDPVDSNIIWSGCYGGNLSRFNERTRHSRSVTAWPDNPMGWAAKDLRYRFQWTFPIAISPHDHNRVFVGSQHVHMTTDGGNSWREISPDLTSNDPEWQGPSGRLTPDNASVEYAPVVFAIAVSPLEEGLIWAGTNDGRLQVTRDSGASWTDVTGNVGMPPFGTISSIEPSRHAAATAYIAVDYHQMNGRDPHLYKTTDYGRTWQKISDGIPKSPLSYTHMVKEDPRRPGMLYVGTENGIYVSWDDGGSWYPLQNNLPHAPVHWIEVQDRFSDLVVATYGRGFWILDDITPLRQLDADLLASDSVLFAPRDAYRFKFISSPMSQPAHPSEGENPPYGAAINYYLREAIDSGAGPSAPPRPAPVGPFAAPVNDGTVPGGPVEITILDAQGEAIRTLHGPSNAGINRIWWDLRHEDPERPVLRTKPEGADNVELNPDGTRELVSWGRARGPLVAPGTYTVRLRVGGQEHRQQLTVLKDPNTEGTEADIRRQLALSLELREDLNTVAGMIDQIELIRSQIYDLMDRLEGRDHIGQVIAECKRLDGKLIGIVKHLYQRLLTGGSQDALRWPIQLYAKLAQLASDVESSDFPPTTQMLEVHEMYRQQMAEHQAALDEIVNTDLPAFEDMLRANGITTIISGRR
ncbi:MAG: WD40/YVTN/BNR-like repeat-containing protein [Acidobacteriota bacterium]